MMTVVVLLTVGAMAAGAGIYKWATPTTTQTDTQTVTQEVIPPKLWRSPNLNSSLIEGLLKQYIRDGPNPGQDCLLRYQTDTGITFFDGYLKTLGVGSNSIVVVYNSRINQWVARATGSNCNGIEVWTIDDSTGAIEYLGPK